MDGKRLTEMFLEAIDKPAVDDLELNARAIFRALDTAAIEYARLTQMLKKSATITTVAGQQRYALPADFVALYVKDAARRLIGKYLTAGGEACWPVCSTFEKLFRADETESRATPERFAVVPLATLPAEITGTTTSLGAAAGGESALNDSGGAFLTTVEVRDTVHNLASGASGLVVAVASDVQAKTALFGGRGSSWASGAAYRITPAATFEVALDAPSESSGDTLTLPYVSLPPPVFTDFAIWPFPQSSCQAIVYEAAFHWSTNKTAGKPRTLHHAAFGEEVRQARREIALQYLQGGNYLQRS